MRKKLRDEIRSPDYYMDMDIYKRLVKELSILGTKIILIDYLEPFMDPQLIEKIKYVKECNLGCIVITNGSLLNEENVEKLVDLRLDYLNVSVNAGTPETYPKIHLTETEGTFERIKSMISLIERTKKEKGTVFPHIRLSMVVCNRNYRDIVKFVELCQETGVKNALIKKLISWSREIAEELGLTHSQVIEMEEYLVEAQKSAKEYGIHLDIEKGELIDSQKTQDVPCYYGWLFSMIDGNGNVHPCCFQDRGQSCTIGNIKEDNFSTLWFSKKYQDFRKMNKNIDERRKMGYLCNEPSCFFNNQQIHNILQKPYTFTF